MDYLEEARKLIHGDRQNTYGHPIDDFRCSAALISAYLSRRLETPIHLSPIDIPAIMNMIKMGRLAGNPLHDDGWIDGAGYCGTAGMVKERMSEREKKALTVHLDEE